MEKMHWAVSSEKMLELDGVHSVRTEIIAGRVDILVHDEPITRIEVSEVEGQPVDISLVAGSLEIKQDTGAARGALGLPMRLRSAPQKNTAVISVAVPKGTSAALRTVNGDGLVCGTCNTSLDTVSGSLMADDTSGALKINTVSGEAIIRQHSGHLVVRTVSGEVTASGYCDNIRANSVSGEITLDLLGEPKDLVAKTVSGDLTVRLPHEMGIDALAVSLSGSLTVNDHRVGVRGTNKHVEPGEAGPTLTVRAHSVSGNVAIFQAHHISGADHGSAETRDGGL